MKKNNFYCLDFYSYKFSERISKLSVHPFNGSSVIEGNHWTNILKENLISQMSGINIWSLNNFEIDRESFFKVTQSKINEVNQDKNFKL